MSIVVPPYQNFVPGKGHVLMPSAFAVKEAQEKGEPIPEGVPNREEYIRLGTPIRKRGYENFIPGKGHKLMETWEQIHQREAAEREAAAEKDPPGEDDGEGAPDPALTSPALHQCQTCEKTFDTYQKLHGHRLSHRGK